MKIKLRQQYKKYINQVITDERIRVYPRIIFFVVIILTVFNWSQFNNLMDGFGNVLGPDFLAFYTAGRYFNEEMNVYLYDLAWQLSFQRQTIGDESLALNSFISPPFSALLYALFSYDNYVISFLIWMITAICCLILSCYFIAAELFKNNYKKIFFCIYCSLTFFPSYLWLFYGQATGILLLLLSLSFVLLRQGKDFRAGFVLGLLAIKPQIALCLLLPLIIQRRYRALAGGCLALLCWSVISYVFFFDEMIQYWEFKAFLPQLILLPGYPTWGVTSVYGFSHLLLDGLSMDAANNLCVFITILALGYIIFHWNKVTWIPASREWDLSIAGSYAIAMLLGLHLFSYDLTLLLLPFFIILPHFKTSAVNRLDGGEILLLTALIYLFAIFGPYLSKFQLFITSSENTPGFAIQFITVFICIWGVVILKQARTYKAEDSQESAMRYTMNKMTAFKTEY